MAEFVKVMEDIRKMCKSFDGTCRGCPLDVGNSGEKSSCNFFDVPESENWRFPKRVEEKAEQWAESHPEKTNLSEIKKVFLKAKLNDNCCLITVFGISKSCGECVKNIYGDSCRERIDNFLNSPYEEPEEK